MLSTQITASISNMPTKGSGAKRGKKKMSSNSRKTPSGMATIDPVLLAEGTVNNSDVASNASRISWTQEMEKALLEGLADVVQYKSDNGWRKAGWQQAIQHMRNTVTSPQSKAQNGLLSVEKAKSFYQRVSEQSFPVIPLLTYPIIEKERPHGCEVLEGAEWNGMG